MSRGGEIGVCSSSIRCGRRQWETGPVEMQSSRIREQRATGVAHCPRVKEGTANVAEVLMRGTIKSSRDLEERQRRGVWLCHGMTLQGSLCSVLALEHGPISPALRSQCRKDSTYRLCVLFPIRFYSQKGSICLTLKKFLKVENCYFRPLLSASDPSRIPL